MKESTRIEKLAEKIVRIEKSLEDTDDPLSAERELMQLAGSMSLEDMLAIDEYIQVHNLLS